MSQSGLHVCGRMSTITHDPRSRASCTTGIADYNCERIFEEVVQICNPERNEGRAPDVLVTEHGLRARSAF